MLSAIFLALAYILPFLTRQIPQVGAMLCPLHIPVIICGFVCGWKYGLVVGFIVPLLRSLTLGMPPLFPTATAMAFELATYGFVAGLMYNILPRTKVYIYLSLIVAMVLGRVIWGIAMLTCMGINNTPFSFTAFISGAVINALPGIILQIVLIPIIIMTIEKLRKTKESI